MSTVVDNTNGNIIWSGASWRNGDKADDPLVDRYFNSTFRHSVNSGDSASIAWKGTDIAVYGARRDNHVSQPHRPRQARKEWKTNNQGIYSVSVDSAEPEYFSGFATGDGQFQAVLFATNGLASGDHTLKIANENSRNIEQYPKYIYLDIDYFALTGELLPGPAAPPGSSSSISASAPSTLSSISSGQSSSIDPASSSGAASSPSGATDSISSATSSASEPGSSAITSASAVTTPTTASSASSVSQVDPASQFTDTGSSRPVTATEGVESMKTTGIPNVSPLTTSTGGIASSETGSDNTDESSNKTTIAVSVSVISVAVVVICTVLGLYLYKRRKARREQEEASQQDHIMSQRDWDY